MNKKIAVLILILLVLICCTPAILDQEKEIPVDIVFKSPDSSLVSLDELFKQVEQNVLEHYPNANLDSFWVKGKCKDSFPEAGEYTINFSEVTDNKTGIFGLGGATRHTTVVLIPANETMKLTTKEMGYAANQARLKLPLPPARQVVQLFELVSLEEKYYSGDCKYFLRVSIEGNEYNINFHWRLSFSGNATEPRPDTITVDYRQKVDN